MYRIVPCASTASAPQQCGFRCLFARRWPSASSWLREKSDAVLQIIMIQTVHEKNLRVRGVFTHLHPQSPKENMVFPSARTTQALHRRGWLWHVLDTKVSRQWRSARLYVEHTGVRKELRRSDASRHRGTKTVPASGAAGANCVTRGDPARST